MNGDSNGFAGSKRMLFLGLYVELNLFLDVLKHKVTCRESLQNDFHARSETRFLFKHLIKLRYVVIQKQSQKKFMLRSLNANSKTEYCNEHNRIWFIEN